MQGAAGGAQQRGPVCDQKFISTFEDRPVEKEIVVRAAGGDACTHVASSAFSGLWLCLLNPGVTDESSLPVLEHAIRHVCGCAANHPGAPPHREEVCRGDAAPWGV